MITMNAVFDTKIDIQEQRITTTNGVANNNEVILCYSVPSFRINIHELEDETFIAETVVTFKKDWKELYIDWDDGNEVVDELFLQHLIKDTERITRYCDLFNTEEKFVEFLTKFNVSLYGTYVLDIKLSEIVSIHSQVNVEGKTC